MAFSADIAAALGLKSPLARYLGGPVNFEGRTIPEIGPHELPYFANVAGNATEREFRVCWLPAARSPISASLVEVPELANLMSLV